MPTQRTPLRFARLMRLSRGVAQLGSALRSGRRGRGFESRHPDCSAWRSSWSYVNCRRSELQSEKVVQGDQASMSQEGDQPRERDSSGRPLNARPRDGLGRPLPRGSQGIERIPDGLVLPPEESLAQAQRLIDSDRPFHAHEVLEGTWKAAPPTERELWQGLAQLAVGLTHALRGNPTGAVAVLSRGRARIAQYAA